MLSDFLSPSLILQCLWFLPFCGFLNWEVGLSLKELSNLSMFTHHVQALPTLSKVWRLPPPSRLLDLTTLLLKACTMLSGIDQQSETFCFDLVHEYYPPIRLLASHRLEFRICLYPNLPRGGFRPVFVFSVSRPFVCGCHNILTIPSIWTIPGLPGSHTFLPHHVVRKHLGTMGGTQRLRHHSAG